MVLSTGISLEAFMENPLDRMEWVNGNLVTKGDMNAKTGRIQARLARYWGNYQESSGQGGEVYTETPCRTSGRVRCPDVAYLPPELVTQYGDFKVLPRSFPLIAEVISPTDEAEEVFMKVREYLASGCEEVWLIFPESQWVLVAD
jgi:Uma2 family endonuclease